MKTRIWIVIAILAMAWVTWFLNTDKGLPPGYGLQTSPRGWRFVEPNGHTGLTHWWRWEAVYFAWEMYNLDEEWKNREIGWKDAK